MGSSRPNFQYRSSHDMPASPETVWSELEEVDLWSRWGRSLSSVRISTEGFEKGTRIDADVDPKGPMRVEVSVELVRCDHPHEIDAEVTGDIEGQGALRLSESAGGCELTIAWNVDVVGGRLRRAARATRPFASWLQRRTTKRLANDFREHLRDR